MKKAAVFTMAAFYLLLTTGMFVCIVHCTAESMVKKPAMVMAHNHGHQPKKHCTDGSSGCDCCKQHGAYVVKENLKPGFDYQFSPTAVLIAFAVPEGPFTTKQQLTNYCWADTKAPPGKSGKALSIQLRSLQI